eukprot:2222909-Prymnesium_polylepis.1
MTFSYMHKLGKCRTMRAKAHVKAKEDRSACSSRSPRAPRTTSQSSECSRGQVWVVRQVPMT